jgi:hypothetical protein
MIKVIDDAMPVSMQEHIEDSVYSRPLIYQPNTSYMSWEKTIESLKRDPNIVDNGQFFHMCMNNGTIHSNYFLACVPVLYLYAEKAGIKVNEIKRVKLNLMTQDKLFDPLNYNAPHVDTSGTYAFVYYVNDSDGDTVLFNEFQHTDYEHDTQDNPLTISQRISPKRGRGVFFESSRYHASSSPKDTALRWVLNFNFV